jgi:hypothetical protein
MIESFHSQLKHQETERSFNAGQLNPASTADRNDLRKLFAKPTSTATFDNLNTAALYSSDSQNFAANEIKIAGETKTDTRGGEAGALAWPRVGEKAPIQQLEHKVKAGETLDGIARRTLGANASEQEVQRYADYVAKINDLTDPNGDASKLHAGQSLKMPGRQSDNSLCYINPKDKNESWQLKADGTNCYKQALDKYGSCTEHHEGPEASDNYDKTYNKKSDCTIITRESENGDTVKTRYSGRNTTTEEATKTIHPNGDWEETGSPELEMSKAKYNAAERTHVATMKDGSTVTTYFNKDTTENHSITITKEGNETCATVRTPDGSYSIEKKDEHGNVTSHCERKYSNDGGYKETGGYTKDGKSYTDNEQFDAKTGTTKRTEQPQGENDHTTTTATTKDGTVTVGAPDGTITTSKKDGSQIVEKDGQKISEKPAYDYKHDAELNKSKEQLNKAVSEHIPAARQADFKKDMAEFEERAAKNHLSPEEVTKTYQQISKMLNASEAVVSNTNRAILAESLIHQCAHPDTTEQGLHNTCNVTCVAENTLVKNPSKAAEMAATTAIDGKWTAPDGKVINIDRNSLIPGAEEKKYPPADSGDRTFATQVLNLVMVNDALQRRNPQQSYVQGEQHRSKHSFDTGERIRDANGNEVKDSANKPIGGPDVTDHEIAQESRRLNGNDTHFVGVHDGLSSVDSVYNENQLKHRLSQFQQQGQLPIILGVDGCHWPIAGVERPGYGGHVVTVDGYDQKTGKIHITNQWGKKCNRWVTIGDLYENASGEAFWKDGANLDW